MKKEQYGENKSYEFLLEEVVASACEMMLKDSKAITKLAQEHYTLAEKIKAFIDAFVEKIKKAFEGVSSRSIEAIVIEDALSDLTQMQEIFDNALIEAVHNSREVINDEIVYDENGDMMFELREEFSNELEKWFETTSEEERKTSGKRFLLGTTTSVLKDIGVKDYNIYFGGAKINKILKENASMDLNIIKDAVHLLNDPILIMESRTVEDSIVLFGEVYAKDDKPVMISVLLNPKTQNGEILDYGVVTSAYGRRKNNLQNLIDKSKIYYINEQKERTDKWLKALGLQLPSALTKYDPINSITKSSKNVKKSLKERVKGDVYENALDTLELVKEIGGTVDEYGYARVYHRTNSENAKKIKDTGIMTAKEDGLFFSTKEKSEYNEGYGNSVIAFDIPVEKLVLDDMFDDELHFRLPLEKTRQLDLSEYLVKANNSDVNSKDAKYLKAVEDGDMETAQKMVDEAAKKAGYVVKAYHGTPNGDFTVFRNWQYFTESKEYADVYQNQGASSNGYKLTANNPKTYSVYLKQDKIFDTRNEKEKRIFENKFYRQWGNGAPLSEKGLPDWTDGDDFVEFFEENDYDYDAILLDEGATGGFGDEVKSRGISIVVKNSNQIKSAEPVVYDDDGNVIPLSKRFDESQDDIRYEKRNVDRRLKKWDNISRKNKVGELINSFYPVLTKEEWSMYYGEISKKHLLKVIVGELAPVVVNNKLILSERQMTGKDAHDFQVYKILEIDEFDQFIFEIIKDYLIAEGVFDARSIKKQIDRFIRNYSYTGILKLYSRGNNGVTVFDYGRQGYSNSGQIYGNSQQTTDGRGVPSGNQQDFQGDGQELKEKRQFTPAQKVARRILKTSDVADLESMYVDVAEKLEEIYSLVDDGKNASEQTKALANEIFDNMVVSNKDNQELYTTLLQTVKDYRIKITDEMKLGFGDEVNLIKSVYPLDDFKKIITKASE